MRVRVFVATALIAGTSLVGMPGTAVGHTAVTTTAEPSGHFTCKATGARVRTLLINATSNQANPGAGACADDFTQVLGAAIPGFPRVPVVTAEVLSARTDADPYGEPGARSDAAVAKAAVLLGTTSLRADALRSHATARCEGGEPVLKGGSEVIGLVQGSTSGSFTGEVRISDPANPLLNIWLNEQTTETDASGNQVLTQRALHIFGLRSNGTRVDIVLAESVVDVHDSPCSPTPPPSPECSDGEDNDGDMLTDFPEDPGCSSPEDDDESDDPK